ncbi:MAG: T9SS type A sorting domain-containing protein [Bacteroidia bacterium]|nr:T9SS type A sorting domain-containing protein [Bacteroidia bacterium]
MKTIYRLFIGIFILILNSNEIKAQIDSTTFYTNEGSLFCQVPAIPTFNINYYGNFQHIADFNVDFGDGQSAQFSSGTGYFNHVFTHSYSTAGSYQATLTITESGQIFTCTIPIIISNTCGVVSGNIYNDFNNNCTLDGGETAYSYQRADLYQNNQFIEYVYSDISGQYEFPNVPIGYNYTVYPRNQYSPSINLIDFCPQSIQINTIPSTSNNFGYYCSPTGFNFASIIHPTGCIPGQSRVMGVTTYNFTCNSPLTATVKILLDPLLTYDNSVTSSIPITISGDTLIYQVTFNSNAFVSNYFNVITSTTATIGDTVCVNILTTPIIGDLNPNNNTGEFCFPVVTSWDPNDKAVFPRGAGAAGNISPTQELIYTINFQNTGTYYAYNIYIDDTLDSDLDINSLRILSSSHYMYTTWPAPNVIRFNFENIFLPDSSIDLNGSMGHVVYSIDPKPALPIGTQITNSAAIYFDYNAPVITNSTLNTISMPTQIQITPELQSTFDVYPNPVVNDAIILINNTGIYSIEVVNITGEIIKTISDISSGESYINLKELGSGIYLIRLVDNNNQTTGLKKIVVQ